jgi:hypothetical protein
VGRAFKFRPRREVRIRRACLSRSPEAPLLGLRPPPFRCSPMGRKFSNWCQSIPTSSLVIRECGNGADNAPSYSDDGSGSISKGRGDSFYIYRAIHSGRLLERHICILRRMMCFYCLHFFFCFAIGASFLHNDRCIAGIIVVLSVTSVSSLMQLERYFIANYLGLSRDRLHAVILISHFIINRFTF